ncbi:putative integral membrane protein [Talaromyces proteolyticus]|uniref:Integral membrane protein n=1 Tax=Talaromyces proteolyticus TaxID=1131652 RepID=A0AAD4Q3Y8_9EURO|nr:putative integral membrane protein [Talaromyces proteolyticus]KAH8702308.1 putative integral membrane protein [Talaromyces proteolyticus]
MEPRAAHALISSVVLTVVAIGFVGARFCARVRILGRLDSSDWVVLVALILSVTFMVVTITEIKYGMGWHEIDLSPDTLTKQMKLFWLAAPFYNATMVLAKISIVLQYSRTFPTKKFNEMCWVLIVFVGAYGTWTVLSAFVNCIPVAKSWDTAISGKCLPKDIVWFTNAGLYIFTDVIIIILAIPAPAVFNLPLRQHIRLSVLFALGGITCIVSICRLNSVRNLLDSTDFTHDTPDFSKWSIIECNIAITCACLPSLYPLLSRLWPSFIPAHISHPISSSRLTTRIGFTYSSINMGRRRAGKHEQSKKEKDMQRGNGGGYGEFHRLQRYPIPGNAFAEDLLRKGSFFNEPRKNEV